MVKFPSSIRQKIILGYVLSFTVIITGAVFTYVNLEIIEDRIMFSNVDSEFFDTTLEIRRFEKNYFLYRKEYDYRENLDFVNKAEELIEKNKEEFKGLMSVTSVDDLQNSLQEYKNLIKEDFLLNKNAKNKAFILEGKIRDKGKEIVAIAEDISRIGHKNVQTLLLTLQRILITATIFLIIIGVVFGYVLLRTVTKPLKLLENSMERISYGGLEKVSINSLDKEIVSLSEAFNKVLRESHLRRKKELAQSERLASLGTLLAGIVHQLNNPLSNISTSCQILIEEIEAKDISYKKELLSSIEAETDRAKDLVRNLLEFTRKKEYNLEVLSLRKLIEDTFKFLRGHIPTKIKVAVNIPGELTIFADRYSMLEVFLNLIKNATEAIMEEGTVTISARVNREENIVEIEVQDTGIGVEPEVLPRIFDPFVTTKETKKGSGLGLFIVHDIIGRHNGSINVESKLQEGTRFLIRLPYKDVKDAI